MLWLLKTNSQQNEIINIPNPYDFYACIRALKKANNEIMNYAQSSQVNENAVRNMINTAHPRTCLYFPVYFGG